MTADIFKPSGIGSIAWYLHTIKSNPDRKGFTYIRKEARGVGQFDEVKTRIEYLVGARYLEKHNKNGTKKNDRYTLTSFGHRYLEEHRDQAEVADFMADAKVDHEGSVERADKKTRSTVKRELAAANQRVVEKSAAIAEGKPSDLLGKSFETQKIPEFVPSAPETPAQRATRLGKSYSLRRDETDIEESNDERDFTSAPDPEQPIEDEPVTEKSAHDGHSVAPVVQQKITPVQSLIDGIKGAAKDILYDKHAADVSVKEVVEFLEGRHE